MKERPNILYIMTDQHRADWLGCAGHPVLRTPHIDSIANRGTRFTNFHVTSPVCMPNRGAIFTGRYPSVNGLRHNGLPLPANANTFVDILRAGGYHTASFGKCHLQPFTDRPLQGTDETPVVNACIPEAKKSDGVSYASEHPDTYAGEEMAEIPKPYYGFDHVRMVTGHSDECGGHYLQWLRRQTADWACLRDRSNQLPHDFSNPQAFRTPIPEELYPTFLHSRSGTGLPGCTLRQPRTILRVCVLPGPASPVHASGEVLGNVQPGRVRDRPALLSSQEPAAAGCRVAAQDGGWHQSREPPAGFHGARTADQGSHGPDRGHDHHDRRCSRWTSCKCWQNRGWTTTPS